MKVRIGVGTSSLNGPRFGQVAQRLDSLGVDSLWLSEQVTGAAVEPFVGMAYALARTSRLKVGTGVAVLPGRNPVVVAKELASLAGLAPRRVLPAFGLAPARPHERDAFPVPAGGGRAALFEESFTLVRRLLSEPAVSFDGEFFRLDGIGLAERPARPLDLWLGGAAPAALRRVGRLADGWLASMVTPAQAEAAVATINEAAAGVGRAVDPEHFGISLQVVLTEDGRLPQRLAAAVERRNPGTDPAEVFPVGWAGVRRAVERYVAAGVSKFVVYPVPPPAGSWDQFLDEFVTHTAPLQT